MVDTNNTNQQDNAQFHPQTQQMGGASAPQQEPTSPDSGGKRKSMVFTIGIIIAALVLIGVAVWYFMWGPAGETLTFSGNESGNQAAAAIMHEGPVARVNGEEVDAAAYNAQVTQLLAQVSQQGADVNDPNIQQQIQEQALQTVVNTELVMQAAADAGVHVSDADVAAQYDQLVASVGGEEEFAARLDEADLTETELRQNIRNDLIVQAYVSSAVDTSAITVTDEEVNEFYAAISAQQEGLPAMEEIRPQIEQQLQAQKQQQAVAALIQELRAAANIEVLVS